MSVQRADGRTPDQARPLSFVRDYTDMAAGSVLVSFGRTKVLCTASVEEDVPRWLKGSGKGWVTAEYSMLPGSTPERNNREAAKGKQSGRTQEIQRLIGRSLRTVTRLELLPDLAITVDCDVLQADGGTRTASICGGYVALHDAITRLVQKGTIKQHALSDFVAAISVGIVGGVPRHAESVGDAGDGQMADHERFERPGQCRLGQPCPGIGRPRRQLFLADSEFSP